MPPSPSTDRLPPREVVEELRGSPRAREVFTSRRLTDHAFASLERRLRNGTTFGVAARIEDAHGRVLLVRLVQPAWTSKWVTPGGGAERGESAREALLREIDEETGVEVGPPVLWKVLHNRYRGAGGRVLTLHFLQYTARYRRGVLRTRVPQEIAEVRWFSRLPVRMEFRGDWLRPPRPRAGDA